MEFLIYLFVESLTACLKLLIVSFICNCKLIESLLNIAISIFFGSLILMLIVGWVTGEI